MKKEDAIKKIKVMGRLGYVFSNIAKALLGIGFVLALLGMIVVLSLPNDFGKATFSGKAKIDIDLEEINLKFKDIGVNLSEEEQEELKEELLEGDGEELRFNNMEFGVVDADVDESSIKIDAKSNDVEIELKDTWVLLLMAALALAATFVVTVFVGKLCAALRDCHSPFEENVIKRLENFAFSLLSWSVVAVISKSIINSFMSGKIQIMVGVDLGMLILVLLILAIAYIFKYGAVLQQESDETL